MGDLISREAVLEALRARGRELQNLSVTSFEKAISLGVAYECVGIVKDAPAVDAEPVRRSRWHYHGDGYYFCGECKKYIVCIGGDADLNYCPNCGAKMDGDSDG